MSARTRWAIVATLVAAPLAGAINVRADAAADSAFLHQYAQTNRFSLGIPTGIRVSPQGDAVLFLRSESRSLVQDLYVFEPAAQIERLLVTADTLLAGTQEQLSREERASRERRRLTARGIASYQVSSDGRQVLVPLSGRLFLVEVASGRFRELKSEHGAADAARFSPDGRKLACVRAGDLYVIDLANGREQRLTTRENPEITHGLAEFVAQEEMDRFEGYWWSPDSRWIAYQRTDTREVEHLYIADPAHPERAPEAWPYPRAGGRNADVRLGVISAEGGATTWVRWDSARYPYLARVVWDSRAPLTILVQNREQTEERLLAIDPRTGAAATLLVERDPAWLDLDPRSPSWLADGSGFLWISDRGGGPRLELHDPRGRTIRALTEAGLGLRELVHVDESRAIVWVLAGTDPTERHLMRVPLGSRGHGARPVTSEHEVDSAWFDDTGDDLYVLEIHTLAGGRRQEVWRTDHERVALLRSVAEEPDRLPEVQLAMVGRPPGIETALVRPRGFERGRRYPVIVHVYGGPMSQMATADRRRYLLDQWVADHGYVVVCVDGRGTPGRGRAWERAIRGDFASAALEDHVTALRALAARNPELDLDRVGVFGWSFGGYFSLMAVMRRPEVFHAAVAGGPVVDWRDYDTHYTERYLGLPQSHAADYDRSSVLTYVSKLRRPLLIVHGTADDNVYLVHSLRLCEALNRAGKDYEFLPLVNQTHMVADPLATVRLYSRLIDHFDRALRPGR
jgi:dipeptidyl-peptidase-4